LPARCSNVTVHRAGNESRECRALAVRFALFLSFEARAINVESTVGSDGRASYRVN